MADSELGGRLPLQPPATLCLAAKALYDRLMRGRLGRSGAFRNRTDDGALIGPFNACLYVPEIGGGFIDLHEAEERATPLSPRVREAIILSVGAVWASAFELYAHRTTAARVGLAVDAVDALATGRAHDSLTAQERLGQSLALELAREHRISDTTYMAAEAAFGREGVVAAVFLAASYLATSAVLNAFEVPAPPAEA